MPSVGAIHATAELTVDKFKAAASMLGVEGAKIAKQMDRAAAGVDRIQSRIDTLNNNLSVTKAQVAAANSVLSASGAELRRLQTDAAAAAMKTDELRAAYEKLSAEFGDNYAKTYFAKEEWQQAETISNDLTAAVERQQKQFDKDTISLQKAEKTVSDYERNLKRARSELDRFKNTFEDLGEELVGKAMEKTADSFDAAGKSAAVLDDAVESLKNKAFKGLGPGISYAIGQLDVFKGATGAAGAAARTLQSGLSRTLEVISPLGAGFVAAAAATAYGAYELYQYASGAKAAKKALEEMTATAEKWKEVQAETVYDTGNDPYASLGISEADFAKVDASTKSWVDSLTKTWTDGKGETDAIVSEYVKSFTDGSDKIREAVEQRRTSLEGLGVEDTGAEEALKQLDAYDKEIEALLKKRQNGFLTDAEIDRLNEISTAKIDLELEYGLKETSGFEKILAGVEADNARLQALGEGPSIDTYADAMKAAALGLNDYRDALGSAYAEQYQLIQGMEDGAEKTQALDRLNQQYAADMAAGMQEYASTLSQLYGTVWQSADVQNGEQGLKNISDLITQFNAGTLTENNLITQMNEQLGQLDESSLVSYMAVATQIVDLFNQGMTVTDLQGLFPEIDVTQMLGGYSTIADFLSAHTGQFEGLEGIFGQGGAVPEEMQRVMATLELDTEALDALLETPQEVKIKFDASDAVIDQPDPVNVLIAAYERGMETGMPPSPSVDAVISGYKQDGSVTVVDWQAAASAVIDYFEASPEAGVDDTAIQNLTAYIGYYDASKATPPTIEPIVVDVVYKRAEGSSAALESGGVEFLGVPFIDSTIDKVRSLTAELQNLGTVNQGLNSAQLFDQFEALSNSGGLAEITSFINDAYATVQSGQALAPEMQAQLQSLLDFIGAVDTSTIGTDLMAGIATNMQAYGWATSASAVATDIENALRTACQTHSPSAMTKPIGTDLTAGVAEGMNDTASITAAAATVSSAALTELQSGMIGSAVIGLNFSQGLAAGIRAGRSGVISAAAAVARAAAAAARSTLDIHSPSGVTMDYGEYFDLGFIAGIKKLEPDVEAAARDALYLEPPSRVLYADRSAPVGGSGTADLEKIADRVAEKIVEGVKNHRTVLNMDGRRVAEINADNTERARNSRNKSIALGYGK